MFPFCRNEYVKFYNSGYLFFLSKVYEGIYEFLAKTKREHKCGSKTDIHIESFVYGSRT